MHMKIDLKSLIKKAVKHNKKSEAASEDSGLSQFAPKIQAEAPVEAPAAPAEKTISDQTQEKIQ